jgi:protein required for attachment to host cells
VDKVAKELDNARNGLRRIVLVAPPRALGDLREACSAEVRALVTNEVAKDLTKLPVHDLVGRLDELLQ